MKIYPGNIMSTKDIKKVSKENAGPIEEECLVWGALDVALRISKCIGMAPLHIRKKGDMHVISLSPIMCVYGYVVAAGLGVMILAGLAIDLSVPPTRSIRVSSQIATTVWILDLAVVFLISTLSNMMAPRRMENMIKHVRSLNEIIASLNGGLLRHSRERQRCVFVCLSVFGSFLMNFMDVLSYRSDAINESKEVKIVYLYSFYNVQCFITILVEVQFILEALLVHTALKNLNDNLEGITKKLGAQKRPSREIRENNLVTPHHISAKEVNVFIDSLSSNQNNWADPSRMNIRKSIQAIRLLNLSYGSICDIIRQIDKENGMILLLLLIALLVHLVVTPYYLISYIFDADITLGPVILQLVWCMYHVIKMLMIVEPGHRTLQEMERTQKLVGELVSNSISQTDQLHTELDLFQRQITLNRVMYAPMGMCILTRPLIASILGGVTTYLVIIVQFQTVAG